MALAFPTSPVDGQQFTYNGIVYVYNATKGVWGVYSATPAAGSNTEVLFNSNSALTGSVNLTYDPVSNVFAVGTNTFVANATSNTVYVSSILTSSGLNITGQANAAYGQANLSYTAANTAQTYANNLSTSVNTTFSTVNSTITAANSAIASLNSAAAAINTNMTAANSAVASLNATMTAANSAISTLNTYSGTVNTSFSATNTNMTAANTAIASVNVAIANINTNMTSANSAIASVNAAIANINTNITAANSAFSTTNGTFATHNTTFGTINTNISAAYTAANNSNLLSGGTIAGNLNVNSTLVVGNLYVTGTTTNVNTTNLIIDSNTILLAANQSYPMVNAYISVERGGTINTSLIWNETTGQWGYSEAANGAFVSFDSIKTLANTGNNTAAGAYAQANLAYTAVNTAQTYANNLSTSVNTTFATINTNITAANSAVASLNAAMTQANSAISSLNSAASTTNTTFGTVNTTFGTVNTNIGNAYTQANNALNTSYSTITTSGNNYIIGVGATGANSLMNSNSSIYFAGNTLYSGNNIVSGYLGIGTTSPTTFLDVNAGRSGTNSAATPTALYVTGTTNDTETSYQAQFRHGNQSQGVGIGYDNIRATGFNSSQNLTIAARGSTGFLYLNINSTDSSLGNNAVTISNTAYVGIGTTSPGKALDVVGVIRTTATTDWPITVVQNTSSSDKYFINCTGAVNSFSVYENNQTAYINSYASMTFRSNQNGGSGGNIYLLGGDVYISGTYYDNNNTSYYVKPSGTSNLSSAVLYGTLKTQSQGLLVGGSDNGTGYGVVRWGDGSDYYHGLVLRGYPNNTTTGYTAVDQMSFFEYGGIFNFYQKNTSVVTLLTRIDYNGNIVTTGNMTAYGSPSDRKLKENIQPLTRGLNTLLKLNPVSFDWKKETKENEMVGITHDFGLIAQDVQEVIPELVRADGEGTLSIRDRGLVSILIKAIQELKAEVDSLKEQIAVG